MHIYGVAKYIKFMLLLMNKWRNCPLSMYAHNVLGYISGMHPNLSKVTMHLNPFWTNYPTHLYKPLIATNGKQKEQQPDCLDVCVHWCVSAYQHSHTFYFFFYLFTFFLVLFCLLHTQTHKDTTEQSNKYMHRQCTLRILDSLFAPDHQLAVANSSSEIESISLYTCRAYFFTFFLVIVIGMNGLSDLIMGIVSGPECKKAWCECINTKMVHQLLCLCLQKHPRKVLRGGGKNSQYYQTHSDTEEIPAHAKKKETREQSDS